MCPWQHILDTYEDDGTQLCMMTCVACGDTDFCWEHDHSATDGVCDCKGEDE